MKKILILTTCLLSVLVASDFSGKEIIRSAAASSAATPSSISTLEDTSSSSSSSSSSSLPARLFPSLVNAFEDYSEESGIKGCRAALLHVGEDLFKEDIFKEMYICFPKCFLKQISSIIGLDFSQVSRNTKRDSGDFISKLVSLLQEAPDLESLTMGKSNKIGDDLLNALATKLYVSG